MGNSMLYFEQTSHHPPIFHFLIQNPVFKCYGYTFPKVSVSPNSFSFEEQGKYFIEFEKDSIYEFHEAEMEGSGLTLGRRLINFTGQVTIKDLVLI